MKDIKTIIEEKDINRLEDLIIKVDGKNYTVVKFLDNGYYCCHIKELPSCVFQCSFKNEQDETIIAKELERISVAMIHSYNKHMSTPGIKNLKSYNTKFNVGKYIIRLSWITPYFSKYWFWYFKKGKFINSITIRILGINFHIGEQGSLNKLLEKIQS